MGVNQGHLGWRLSQWVRRRRVAFRAMTFFVGVLAFAAVLLWGRAHVLAQEAIYQEVPAPSSVDEVVTPMSRTFLEKKWRPGLFPWLKEKLKDTPAFFRDTKLDLHLRTNYFHEDDHGSQTKEAWAIGGALSYQSGWLLDHFSLGAVLYTSQPLYAPDDRDGTLLLAPGQKGYTVLGQIYGRVRLVEENFLNIYRYETDTPFINRNDSRMTPNTFEGYGFRGSTGGKDGSPGLTYGVGYIDKIKTRNDSTFQSMSQAAGAQVARGVFAGGLIYSYRGFQIGGIDYYSPDIINIGYGETRYTLKITDLLGALFAAQFTDQQSVGANLLNGSSFHGTQWGLMTNISYRNGILTLAYTNVSTGADMQNPWSSFPGYTTVQVKDFDRAGEEAFLIRGSLNFARFGLQEFTTYASWVHGWGAVNPVNDSPVFQQDEYNLDLQWIPKGEFLKGFWFRARYAHIDSREGNSTGFPIDEVRLIINYNFPLL